MFWQKGKRILHMLKKGWERAGFYISLAACILLVGGAAYYARSQPPYVPAPAEKTENASAQAGYAQVMEEIFKYAQKQGEEEKPLFAWPVAGELAAEHMPDIPVWSQTLSLWQTHTGIDIIAPEGVVVGAAAEGTVKAVYADSMLGNVVEIEHEGGWVSRYGALSTRDYVKEGDVVTRGQAVGAVGNTARSESLLGAHLHFELIRAGVPANPLTEIGSPISE